ncbi:MAG TPA: hypothetical protein VGP82_12830 [Ktedonobacterales bacterium]|jgi:hypothetical protein|nr:hypothetical protein [Ktedonobacterales bacterium]
MTGGHANKYHDAWPDLPASAPQGDAAVAVTAMQRGSTASDGGGLLPRETGYPRESEVVCFVSPTTGDWSLYRYIGDNPYDDWTYLAGDTSSAIHSGPETTNRLLVVMHGSESICYVNDASVGKVVDEDGPQGGRMGV